MQPVNVHAAKTHLYRLLQRVALGETIMITKRGRPIARLMPVAQARGLADLLGIDRGRMRVAEDFNAPLPDKVLSASRALRRAATRRRAVPPAGSAGESPPRHARLAMDPRRTRAALSRGPVSARRPRPSVLLLSCQRLGDRHQAGARVCRSCCCARALLLA